MDPALLKEREAFKKRLLATPVVERKKREETPTDDGPKKKIKKEPSSSSAPSSVAGLTNRDFFSRVTASSTNNLAVLSKIIKQMKYRFSQGDADAVTMEDLIEDTNQMDISNSQKRWLETEALVNNPKVEVLDDNGITKYKFKPPFKLSNQKSVIRLLDKYEREGKGGIFLEDIQESLPKSDFDKIFDKLNKDKVPKIVILTQNKKNVVYYNDTTLKLDIDEEFQKLWRSVAVDGLDENKIEDYLTKNGITSMSTSVGLGNPVQKRKKPTKRARSFKKTNEHVADLLQDYSDKQ